MRIPSTATRCAIGVTPPWPLAVAGACRAVGSGLVDIKVVTFAVISAALWVYERDAFLPYEAIAILAIVLLNATMGYVQESRAEAAVAALRAMSAGDATVIRNGNRHSIPAAEIVPTVPGRAKLVRRTGCSCFLKNCGALQKTVTARKKPCCAIIW